MELRTMGMHVDGIDGRHVRFAFMTRDFFCLPCVKCTYLSYTAMNQSELSCLTSNYLIMLAPRGINRSSRNCNIRALSMSNSRRFYNSVVGLVVFESPEIIGSTLLLHHCYYHVCLLAYDWLVIGMWLTCDWLLIDLWLTCNWHMIDLWLTCV